MSKKKFYIITTCCLIAVLIVFEMIMYYAVGEDVLLQKGPMRTLWICFSLFIVALSIVRDIIMKKIYKNKENKDD